MKALKYTLLSSLFKKDGVFGAFIVRDDKQNDPNGQLYDYDLKEHYITLIEWASLSFQSLYGSYTHSGLYFTEHIILINGKGALPESSQLNVPLETYKVKKGSRYRFRIINTGVSFCAMSISIDGHNLTLIASDGQPIVPIQVESLLSHSGERYDFVVEANQEANDYWIKVRGEGVCYANKLSQRAILRYERDDLSNQLTSNINFTFNDSLRNGLVNKRINI